MQQLLHVAVNTFGNAVMCNKYKQELGVFNSQYKQLLIARECQVENLNRFNLLAKTIFK